MPTPIDKALNSKNTFLVFSGIVTAVAAWSIWGQEMFPRESDPTGDPNTWTREELRRWLSARNLLPSARASNEELLERVKNNLQIPRT